MDIYSDDITAYGTIALALIAIVTLYIQSRSLRLGRAADVILKLIDKFDDEKMLNLRHKAATAIRDYRAGKGDISKDVENVLDFYETIGSFCGVAKQACLYDDGLWYNLLF